MKLVEMIKKKPAVLITLDSMKDPNTGFFYFGKALFNSITKQNNNKFDLSFYVKDKIGFFDKKLQLYHLHKFHKLFFPFFNRFDVVHITDQFCRLRPGKVNAKKILTIHDLNQLHQPGYSEGDRQAFKKKLAGYIAKCNKVVAISEFVADDICNNFPESAAKVSVIYNGADKLPADDHHQPAYIPKKPFLFTLGPLNEKKNFHVLPALLANNDYELVIAGITPVPAYTDLTKNEAQKFNALDRLTITGPITDQDKAWYYKNCSAFLFPSLAEGFGLPVIEAMNFGKPVFLSKYTSLPEVGGHAAFYFKNFDTLNMQETFKNGMIKFKNNDMAALVTKHAAKFNWDATASAYLDLYNELSTKK